MASASASPGSWRAAAERSGSPALKADSLHYATDLWVNGAALVALARRALDRLVPPADPLVALAVAAFVFQRGASLAAGGDGRPLRPRPAARRSWAASAPWSPPSPRASSACTT